MRRLPVVERYSPDYAPEKVAGLATKFLVVNACVRAVQRHFQERFGHGILTVQAPDLVTFNHHKYNLIAAQGPSLFSPQDHGLEPEAIGSSCWRGYICVYQCSNGLLTLQTLHIKLKRKISSFLGRSPKFSPRDRFFSGVVYESLNHQCDFTGGVLIGRDPISELCPRRGNPLFWQYKEVHELVFENGHLLKDSDVSEQLSGCRRSLYAELKSYVGDAGTAERTRLRNVMAGHLNEWTDHQYCGAGDTTEHVRLKALQALGQRRDAEAMQLRIDALKDASSAVRHMAARSLGCQGMTTEKAVQPLLQALDDPEPFVRDAAEKSLRNVRLRLSKRDDQPNSYETSRPE